VIDQLELHNNKLVNLGLFAISLIPLMLYAYLISQRIHIPFDLEWGEGAGINQIYRHLAGEKIYTRPTLEFSPLVYTPFYYWISALIARMNIPVTFAGRIISVLASFGSAGILAWLVSQKTRNPFSGWLSGSLYLACFALSDGYYDLVRVDSLYILSLLIALIILIKSEGFIGKVIGGMAIALSFYIKQSALIVFIPILIFLALKAWRTFLPVLLAAITGVIVPYITINMFSGGWLSYYIFSLPREHGYSILSAVNFWVGDIIRPLGIAVGFGIAYLVHSWGNITNRAANTPNPENESHDYDDCSSESLSIYFLFALGAISAGWITRSSNGGGANNAMSAYAAIALMFGFGFDAVNRIVNELDETKRKFALLAPGLVTLQFIGLIYNPFNYLPTQPELNANKKLVEYLGDIEGAVLIPYRSHLAILAEGESAIHAVNLFELTGYFKGDILPEGLDLVQQLRENICLQDYSAVVLDQPIPWIDEQLSIAYQQDDRFRFKLDEKRSPQLNWQGGFDAFFIPRPDHDVAICLEYIESDKNE
jgi:hypothetical protein